MAEAKGWDTAGEQLITVGRTEEWSAGRNHIRSQELQKLPALPGWSLRFCSEGWNTFAVLRVMDTSTSGYFSTKPSSRISFFFPLRGFQKLKFPEIPPGLTSLSMYCVSGDTEHQPTTLGHPALQFQHS